MIWGRFGSDYISDVDNAWLRMDDRTNRMVITAVLTFEDPVEYDDLVERFDERLTNFDRFRQRLVEPWHGLRPRWEEDPLYDVEDHVSHVALPEPQGDEELQEFVADLMDEPLDPDRPLWQAWLVEGVSDSNALVVRVHHAVADGFALVYVLYGLADDPGSVELPVGDLPPLPGEEGFSEHMESKGEPDEERGQGFLDRVSPSQLRDDLEDVRETGEAVWETVQLPREPDTVLRGPLQQKKKVSWTESFDLEEMKEAGKMQGGTVNDFVLAATAGAFRRYMEEQGDDVPEDLDVRAGVPVNLEPLEHRQEQLGNSFGFGYVELPVGVEDPGERIQVVQDRTGVLKQGTDAHMMYQALEAVGGMPDEIQDLASLGFRDRVTAVVSNVPGPVDSLEIAGAEVDDVLFWVPTPEDIGVGVSIFSYDGRVRVGVAVDGNLVPEPERMSTAFEHEVEEMIDAALPTRGDEDTGASQEPPET